MSGLDPRQVLELAIRPALAIMGPSYSTVAAEQLVCGTFAVESGFQWIKQRGNGPAFGLAQVEPETFRDLWSRIPEDLRFVMAILAGDMNPEPHFVAWNLRLCAAMCRLKYKDAKPALPAAGDIDHMESYHKRYYNSFLGATKPGDFKRAWARLIQPDTGRMWP